nr:MAG TPA: hypothetical protein [Crassvirales sp.]
MYCFILFFGLLELVHNYFIVYIVIHETTIYQPPPPQFYL